MNTPISRIVVFIVALLAALVSACSISPKADLVTRSDMDGNYFRLSIADSTSPRETDVWAMVLRKDSLVMEKYVEDFDRAGVFGPEFRLDSSRRYHLSEEDSNRLWQIVRSADPTKWEGIYSAGYERSGNVTWNTTYLTGVRTYVSHGRN